MFGKRRRRRPDARRSSRFRVAVLGGCALVMFSIIFFRLWYLQVLSGDKYLAEAKNNQVREVTVQAPRGEIVDRDGKVLVDNRTALALQIRTEELPGGNAGAAPASSRGSAEVTGMSPDARSRRQIRKQTQELAGEPGDARARRPLRPRLLPAREPGHVPGRQRRPRLRPPVPEGTLAAHMLGYVREVSADQLKEPRYPGARPRRPGRPGRGRVHLRQRPARGQRRRPGCRSTPRGRPTGGTLSRAPAPGRRQPAADDRHAGLQRAGEAAMARSARPGALRRDERAQRRGPRPRLRPDLRPLGVRPAP